MNLCVERTKLQNDIADLQNELDTITSDINRHTVWCDQVLTEIHTVKSKNESMKIEAKSAEEKCKLMVARKDDYERSILPIQSCIDENNERIASLNRQLEEDFPDVSAEELEHLMAACSQEIKKYEDNIALRTSELTDLQNRIDAAREKLSVDSREKENLSQQASSISLSRDCHTVISAKMEAELEEVANKLRAEQGKLDDLEKVIIRRKEKLEAVETRRSAILEARERTENERAKADRKKKRHETQIAYLKLMMAARAKNLKPDYYRRYKDRSRQELLGALIELNGEIKRLLRVVNKYASDRLKKLSEQLWKLNNELKEVSSVEPLISRFIKVYRLARGSVNAAAYDLIKAGFQQRFRELVPGGKGIVTLHKKNNGKLSGIEVNVSFGGERFTRNLNLLSGGQKTLVTLAFLLSAYFVELTPVYMFDEMDAGLDERRSQVVAAQIGRLSKDSQFIMATLKRDFVKVADMCFRVINRNGVSHVREVTAQEALRFLQAPAFHQNQPERRSDDSE